MGRDGGTKKWCPGCKNYCVVTAISTSSLGVKSGQRWYSLAHDDIQWFRRGQECQTCGHAWLSAEVPESFVHELIELRNALRDIKENAEAYAKESEGAAKSLAKLNESLSVLKALKIYQRQS
jgi:hypothetical protein